MVGVVMVSERKSNAEAETPGEAQLLGLEDLMCVPLVVAVAPLAIVCLGWSEDVKGR